MAQFGRALGLGPRCRRFKSCHPYHMAGWKLSHAIFNIGSRLSFKLFILPSHYHKDETETLEQGFHD